MSDARTRISLEGPLVGFSQIRSMETCIRIEMVGRRYPTTPRNFLSRRCGFHPSGSKPRLTQRLGPMTWNERSLHAPLSSAEPRPRSWHFLLRSLIDRMESSNWGARTLNRDSRAPKARALPFLARLLQWRSSVVLNQLVFGRRLLFTGLAATSNEGRCSVASSAIAFSHTEPRAGTRRSPPSSYQPLLLFRFIASALRFS